MPRHTLQNYRAETHQLNTKCLRPLYRLFLPPAPISSLSEREEVFSSADYVRHAVAGGDICRSLTKALSSRAYRLHDARGI